MQPNLCKLIEEFHLKFGLEYKGPPRELEVELSEFRSQFMAEELDEYNDACVNGNIEKQLDALVDLVYVALGTAYLHGFDFNEAFNRVHAANMKKVRALSASQSLRNSPYDVVKPEDWTPANLSDLVK
jgi:predicted HAD superfamily Cof-like phosphohydrolase